MWTAKAILSILYLMWWSVLMKRPARYEKKISQSQEKIISSIEDSVACSRLSDGGEERKMLEWVEKNQVMLGDGGVAPTLFTRLPLSENLEQAMHSATYKDSIANG